MSLSLENVKVSKYEKNRAFKHVNIEGKYPHLSTFATAAFALLNDKLDKEKSKKWINSLF